MARGETHPFRRSISFGVAYWLVSAAVVVRAESVEFNRDVRPILSDKCFACHGPEAASRQGGLRLDQREGAVAEADSGLVAVVPGDPDASELIARITSEDEALRMPPVDSHKTLSSKEIETLRQWIAEGAHWQQHWSFIRPERPELPPVANGAWARGEIDRFVLARLEQEKLSPSPEADRVTLLRRVTLDLTGLAPTAEEVDAFVADHRSDAYERVVDRLLASPRYGEHMARFWLDAARYGDTHGLHLDNYREMWPFRDWVVSAFNRNLPFDQFIVEQLAGDLLPEATNDQLIASGFNRCHVSTNEGGVIPEEVYVTSVVDRVETFGTVMLGLTVGCTRCHDHKYDPLTMGDFYSLFAYFNSLDGDEMDGNREDPAPVVRAPTAQQSAKLAELDSRIAAAEERLLADWPDLDLQQTQWEQQFASIDSEASPPQSVGGSSQTPDQASPSAAPRQDYLAMSDWHWVGPFSDTQRYLLRRKHGPEKTKKKIDLAQKFQLPTGEEIGWVRKPEWVDGQVHNDLPGDPAANFLYRTITVSEPQELEISLGSDDGIRVFLNNKLVLKSDESRPAAADQNKVTLQLRRGKNHLLLKVLNFGGPSGFYFAAKTDLPIMPPDVLAALQRPASERTSDQAKSVRQFFRITAARSPQLDQLRADLNAARRERTEVDTAIPTTLVFKESAAPKPAYILNRGEYDQKGEEVQRRIPTVLPPMKSGTPNNRLGLAQWVVDRDNPLAARVAVNRYWQQFFGVGLVKTSNDFGAQGEPPSHPELLDWLAVDFMDGGWDVKRLVRQIVLSAAYRQSSQAPPDQYRADPENRLLARGSRYRLDAEVLRDQALQVSGLLLERLGGPGVKPPQPAGLWEAVGYSGSNTVKFVPDEGHEKIHRRTLYTFIKRTAPPPQMNTFDAPSRESCIVRRERTNTPLQALLLLNDPQYVEAARGLAERTMHEAAGAADQRARFMFRTATCREPRVDELADLVEAYHVELDHYRNDPKAAESLIASGTMPVDESLDPAELAAWTMAANVVLNLDEVVTRN
jgi:hypothetical protein